MGMTESGREGNSVYLRGWEDYDFPTVKLTRGKFPQEPPNGVPHPPAREGFKGGLLHL